jgi:hypothetical protein
MGAIRPSKMPKGETLTRKDGDKFTMYKKGGSVSRVNEAGNYTKPGMRKALFEKIRAGGKGGAPGQWSARKAQMLAMQYKKSGGGYKD